MVTRERIFRRTEAGVAAWASDKSGLPLPYRRILGLVQGDTHFVVIRCGMTNCADDEIARWVEELQTLNFLASDSAGVECDLDFTMKPMKATRAR